MLFQSEETRERKNSSSGGPECPKFCRKKMEYKKLPIRILNTSIFLWYYIEKKNFIQMNFNLSTLTKKIFHIHSIEKKIQNLSALKLALERKQWWFQVCETNNRLENFILNLFISFEKSPNWISSVLKLTFFFIRINFDRSIDGVGC